jgi:hypothetical protein
MKTIYKVNFIQNGKGKLAVGYKKDNSKWKIRYYANLEPVDSEIDESELTIFTETKKVFNPNF